MTTPTTDTYAGVPVRRGLYQCGDWQRMAENLMAFQDAVQEALGTEEAGDVLQAIMRLKVREPITEHAIRMSGGGMQIRNGGPHVEKIFPLAEWIESEQRYGGRVWRRTVIVVDDWREVERAEGDDLGPTVTEILDRQWGAGDVTPGPCGHDGCNHRRGHDGRHSWQDGSDHG